ncbi:hypothetical protein EE612_022944 [Oryza sativa]|nr:hypothetical protein EE612_022944 [Oryza sativa]
MAQLGDPATRPEEDFCFIPTSYAIDEELREWGNTAAVSWAIRAPPSTGALEIEEVIREEFKLHQGEVAVSLHHPEAFLIKFQHRRHCEDVVKKGFAKRRGIEVHFIKWRSLQNALGVALMFRVRLCLDGMPMHAWAADITERLIGRTCALEQIETDLVHPVESGNTRTINLWAWTVNPSTIPKRMWLGFTKRAKDKQAEILFVEEKPPKHWQKGVHHPVPFHLEEIHDYTSAGVILTDETTCQPTRRRLPPWNLGVLDGEPVPARAFETFPHHPQPPRSVHERLGRNKERDDDDRVGRDDRRSRDNRGKGGRDRSREERNGRDENDDRGGRDDRGDRDERGERSVRDGRRGRGGRRNERPWRRREYNDDHPSFFDNQRRRDHDGDDDNDGRGRRDLARGRESWKHGEAKYRRERTRSPRPRDKENSNRYRGWRNRGVEGDGEPTEPELTLPHQRENDAMVSKFQFLLAMHSPVLKDNLAAEEFNQTTTLMEKIQEPAREGDEAWSLLEPIPVSRVLARIKGDLPANVSPQETTRQEIEEALARMEVAVAAATEEPLLSPQSPCWTAVHLPAANKADTIVLQSPGQNIVAEAAATNTPRGVTRTAMTSVTPTQLALPVANKADILAL